MFSGKHVGVFNESPGKSLRPAGAIAWAKISYGEGTSAGQFGAVAPFESVQLMHPPGAASTNGEIGDSAAI